MSTRALYVRCLLALAVLAQPFAVSANGAEPILGRAFRLVEEAKYEGTEPRTGYDGSVELLAQNIDWLEHHIDTSLRTLPAKS